jgi:hypothetical protein
MSFTKMVVLIMEIGIEFAKWQTARCDQWNVDRSTAESNVTNQEFIAKLHVGGYTERAQLNCRHARLYPESYTSGKEEFCSDYSLDKIPKAWKAKACNWNEFLYLQKYPGMALSCYAQKAKEHIKTLRSYQQKLARIQRQQPSGCKKDK